MGEHTGMPSNARNKTNAVHILHFTLNAALEEISKAVKMEIVIKKMKGSGLKKTCYKR